jgi:undecaprenyl-diphosphatase
VGVFLTFTTKTVRPRFKQLTKFLKARVSSKKFAGLYLTLCLLGLIAAIWLFGALAEDVATGDPITILDIRFSVWLHQHSSASITILMRVITELHSLWVVSLITLALCAYWWARGLRHRVNTLIMAVFGGMLLNLLLKHLFLRARPQFENPILTLTTYSFPSGHTMMATVFYGTICWFVVSRPSLGRLSWLAIPLALVLITLVGFSRIYLGVHYLSDVLGAMAEGLAWLAFCLISAEALSIGTGKTATSNL